MNSSAITPLDPPRVVQGKELVILGLHRQYFSSSNAGIPSQWADFIPSIEQIENRKPNTTYGVIYNSDEAGNFDYLCGVEIVSPRTPLSNLTLLTIPAQTYAVFEHKDHVSSIAATMKAIWNQGLPAAGHQPIDAPSFERYSERFNPLTGLGGLELWIPIQSKN